MLAVALNIAAQNSATTPDPEELVRLRQAYDAAVARTVKPLIESYVVDLDKLRDSFTKSSKLEEALVIDRELQAANARIADLSKGDASKAAALGMTGKRVRISIPANDANGYRIGPVGKGTRITLQYADGLWKSHGGIATANPDDPQVDRGDANRLAIAAAAKDDKPGEIIQVVSSDTKQRPFDYVFKADFEDVVLRIGNNNVRKENPGTVVYDMTLSR